MKNSILKKTSNKRESSKETKKVTISSALPRRNSLGSNKGKSKEGPSPREQEKDLAVQGNVFRSNYLEAESGSQAKKEQKSGSLKDLSSLTQDQLAELASIEKVKVTRANAAEFRMRNSPSIRSKSAQDPPLKFHKEICESHLLCKKPYILISHEPNLQELYLDTFQEPKDDKRPKEERNGEPIVLPKPKEDPSIYLTKETLDDWFAQSINRSYQSVAHRSKHYHIPVLPHCFSKLQRTEQHCGLDQEVL